VLSSGHVGHNPIQNELRLADRMLHREYLSRRRAPRLRRFDGWFSEPDGTVLKSARLIRCGGYNLRASVRLKKAKAFSELPELPGQIFATEVDCLTVTLWSMMLQFIAHCESGATDIHDTGLRGSIGRMLDPLLHPFLLLKDPSGTIGLSVEKSSAGKWKFFNPTYFMGISRTER
jgi:hypothetical protein